ncbi:MAG: tRNA (adenosine(37)-N6)-threonylcarbamoyltransferase complex dimerization subunit type 1 TsaB [Nitrospirae bacterium]|nr:tRNA (adenosine(37)-N6)-threonylcarbamoyltransferase complex dimerization subunit type 1 TsaB [Nitrospirota bacterium]
MITLGIDTSAAEGGVALCKDDEVLTELMMKSPLQHAEELLPLIDEALSRCELEISDVELVSVNSGPGSFTGLRIGLATAKGICQAVEIPLVGIDGWRMFRERDTADDHARVCVVIENRRDLYYVQWFIDGTPLHEAAVLPGDEVVEKIRTEKRPLRVIGSGVPGLRERLADCRGDEKYVAEHCGAKCCFADCASDELNQQSPATIARLGARSFSQDQLYSLEPVYVEPVLARMSK